MNSEKLIIRYIEMTGRCNLNCPICVDRYRNFDMDINDFVSIVEANKDLIKGNRIWLDFNGEPLVDPLFFERVELLVQAGAITQISTNGLLLDQENCDKLVRSGIDYVVVSVSTLDRELYAKIRGIDALPTVLENIDRLRNMVLQNKSPMDIQGVAIDCGNLDTKSFVKYFHDRGIHAAVHKFTNRSQFSRLHLNVTYQKPQFRTACQGLKQNIAILANCDVVCCCSDFKGQNVLGNLRDHHYSVKDLIAKSGLEQMIKKQEEGIFEGACVSCDDWIYHQKGNSAEYVVVYPFTGSMKK